MIDVLGFGDSDLGKKLKSGADAFNKGSQAASDFATGNYIGAAINGVGAIKSLGSALGIGNGSNAKEVAETTNRLTESNERLQYSIEQLKSSIDKTSGMSAVSNYQKPMMHRSKSISRVWKFFNHRWVTTARTTLTLIIGICQHRTMRLSIAR